MNKKTLAALIAGAEKWERNALVVDPDKAEIWDDTCKLCHLFVMKDCNGCPVREKTGAMHCAGTPWERAASTLVGWGSIYWLGDTRENRNARNKFRRAAKAEAKFLRSLIPADAA